MSCNKGELLWSPTLDHHFVTCDSSVSLYKVENSDDLFTTKPILLLSDRTSAVRVAVCGSSDVQYLKCIALYPGIDHPNLLAVGTAVGKVILTNFGDSGKNELVGKEFSLRHQRQCNYLSWNPIDMNLLAEGFDKHRNDCCIAVWDVNAKMTEVPLSERQRNNSSEWSISKPFVELGFSESSSSFSWKPGEAKIFVTGMNKFLKVFDIQDFSRPQLATQTKATHGVCIDPLFPNAVASYTESLVSVWDLRKFNEPLLTIADTRPVSKVSWCPTRSAVHYLCSFYGKRRQMSLMLKVLRLCSGLSTRMGLLCILCKENANLRLCDIKHSVLGSDELETAFIERNIHSNDQEAISSFAWHLEQENRLLMVTARNLITDVKIFDRIALDWSSQSCLTLASGKRKEEVRLTKELELEDIGLVMKKRALRGYGTQGDELQQNAMAVKDDLALCRLWTWMASRDASSEEKRRNSQSDSCSFDGGERFMGIQGVLGSSIKSDKAFHQWQGLEGADIRVKLLYNSEERYAALQLCGWGNLREKNGLHKLLYELQRTGEYERAAAIALFNLQLKRALDILNSVERNDKDKDINLNVMAMALAGFTENRTALWHKMCSGFLQQLTNPYLRAMFVLLSSDKENYTDVLREDGMAVRDRVAFACMFLPDGQLVEYINQLTNELTEAGDLDGILLTGLTCKGVDLLQHYIDITGDVQTASLIAMATFPSQIAVDKRVVTWIDSIWEAGEYSQPGAMYLLLSLTCYKSLLCMWKLWHQRALFDIMWHSCDSVNRVQSKVFVSCNFCGKSVSHTVQPVMKNRLNQGCRTPTAAQKLKVTCCPKCRKPLPRCALCLTNLGTASGTTISKEPNALTRETKTASFDGWFTWCQTCRHGGHAAHILEWFRDHSECPVAGCSCKCMSIDLVARETAEVNT